MASSKTKNLEAQRAYHAELRSVARLLRWSGMALVLVGTIGIALGESGAWFHAPSWFCFVIGWALMLSGVVRRVRLPRAGGN